jgi:hypothetical protein
VKTLFLRRPAALLTALTLVACAPGVDAPPSYRGGGAEPVGQRGSAQQRKPVE